MLSERDLERICTATLAGRFGVVAFPESTMTAQVLRPSLAGVANLPDVSPERAVACRGPEQGNFKR
jgi:hypothetical protein